MKKILAAATAAVLLITGTSCSGFLDEELKKNWLRIIHIPAAMALKSV